MQVHKNGARSISIWSMITVVNQRSLWYKKVIYITELRLNLCAVLLEWPYREWYLIFYLSIRKKIIKLFIKRSFVKSKNLKLFWMQVMPYRSYTNAHFTSKIQIKCIYVCRKIVSFNSKYYIFILNFLKIHS